MCAHGCVRVAVGVWVCWVSLSACVESLGLGWFGFGVLVSPRARFVLGLPWPWFCS
jgi:hypothetical protein